MSYYELKIRRVSDASTALSNLLEPLRRAVGFADHIIATNTFRVQVTDLWHLVAAYRGLDERLSEMARRLQNCGGAPMDRMDGKALETLLQDPNLNFYKAANSLQGAFAAYNSHRSSTQQSRVISSVMEKVPGFQSSARDAVAVVSRIKGIVKTYTDDGRGSHYPPLSGSSSRHVTHDADTNVAQAGSRTSRHSSRRSSAPRSNRYAGNDNWSTVAQHGGRSPDRNVTRAPAPQAIWGDYTGKENHPSGHATNYMHGSHKSRRHSRR